MKRHENLVLASVRGNYSDDIVSMFTCAVVVEVPKEIRMKRVRDRAYRQFGDRILPGGDLRGQQERFFAMVENRPEDYATKWLEEVNIPVIYVDGTASVESSVMKITDKLVELGFTEKKAF